MSFCPQTPSGAIPNRERQYANTLSRGVRKKWWKTVHFGEMFSACILMLATALREIRHTWLLWGQRISRGHEAGEKNQPENMLSSHSHWETDYHRAKEALLKKKKGLPQGTLGQRVSGLWDSLTSIRWYLNNLPERKQIPRTLTFSAGTLSLIMSNVRPCPEVRPTLTQ